jgi:hypothetical protein
MTCHAIYWQQARTKSKYIDSSDRLTAVCVCQRVNHRNNSKGRMYTLELAILYEVVSEVTVHVILRKTRQSENCREFTA